MSVLKTITKLWANASTDKMYLLTKLSYLNWLKKKPSGRWMELNGPNSARIGLELLPPGCRSSWLIAPAQVVSCYSTAGHTKWIPRRHDHVAPRTWWQTRFLRRRGSPRCKRKPWNEISDGFLKAHANHRWIFHRRVGDVRYMLF